MADSFVSWLGAPTGHRWLDVGCGTGVLAETVLAAVAPVEVTGVDASDGFIQRARSQVTDSRAHFEVGDAISLPFADGRFDAVVSGLMLNFIADPARAAAELARVAAPGATRCRVRVGLHRRHGDVAVLLGRGCCTRPDRR